MKFLRQSIAVLALIGGLSATFMAQGADDGKAQADPTLKGDAVCTKCHDADGKKPILSIYQTRHGVKGDSRTPGCQSCHGASNDHLKSRTNPPDVKYTK